MRKVQDNACMRVVVPSFVYVLKCENPDGRAVTYVGWTLDLERRLAEHNGKKSGAHKGARTTRGRAWALVYAEKHRTRKGAMRREVVLKRDKKFRALLRQC
jgi:putative endonuclease